MVLGSNPRGPTNSALSHEAGSPGVSEAGLVASGPAGCLEFFETHVRLLDPHEKPHLAIFSSGGGWVGGFSAASGGCFVSGPDPQIEGLTSSTRKIERIPGARDDLKPFHSGLQFVLAGIDEKGQIFPIEESSELFTIEINIDAIYAPKGIITINVDEGVLGVRRGERLEAGSGWGRGSTAGGQKT